MGPHIESYFTVRSYEVDSYAHLNNGVYVSWFEQGRLDFLTSLGFSYNGFADREEWFVVARTEIDFKAALHVGDEAIVTTEVESLGRTSVCFHQVLSGVKGGTPVETAASEARTVMVFSHHGESIPIPEDFRAALATDTP
jgi:acyl-CoA thioester hydrolase